MAAYGARILPISPRIFGFGIAGIARVWGASHFQTIGCRAFHRNYEEGLGGKAEQTALFAAIMRQALLSRKSRVGGR